MMTEEKVLKSLDLSANEYKAYDYIKEKCQQNGGSMKESLKVIGQGIQVSEATVSRAVKKLKSKGIIGIIPSGEKAESNEIVYYGVSDPAERAQDIFKLIATLSSDAKQFETLLQSKDEEIERYKRELENQKSINEQLHLELKQARALQSTGIDPSKVKHRQTLENGDIAIIIAPDK